VIFLDRDGVLNEMVVNSDHGLVDSPLHPDQVVVNPKVSEALAGLSRLGFSFVVVTNQPSAAKQRTTRENLERTHALVIEKAEAGQTKIAASYICFHRSEDNCDCRKPRTGMFEQARNELPWIDWNASWMVGDGATDVEAGKKVGLKTAFLGPKKCDACKVFDGSLGAPEFWGKSLFDFYLHLNRN